jgi:hypothetical protein
MEMLSGFGNRLAARATCYLNRRSRIRAGSILTNNIEQRKTACGQR